MKLTPPPGAFCALTLTALCLSQPASATPVTAKKADALVDSIGVNIHIHHNNTPYGNWPNVKAALQNIGLRHIRDGLVNTTWQPFYDRNNELPGIGVKGVYICSDPMATTLTTAANIPNAIEAFEGPNEANQNGWTAPNVAAYQSSLYTTIKGNATFSNRTVVALSYTDGGYAASLGNLSASLDKGNFHPYPGGQMPENGNSLQAQLTIAQGVSGGKPVWATETGYNNAVNSVGGHLPASEAAAGKYAGRLILFNWNKGVERNYFYDLINDFDNPGLTDAESHFGLYQYNGTTIKPAGTAIKNLIGTLSDATFNTTTQTWSSPAFTPGSLDYFIGGNAQNVNQTLVQKSDGKFYLILWQGVSSYNTTTRTDITNPTVPVTLYLNTAIASARQFTPYTSATSTPLTITNSRIALNVPDHPLIVELTPGGSAAAYSQFTVGPEADSFVDTLNPTNNMGTWTGMNVAKTSATNRTQQGFFRFSLSGVTGTVVSAYLRLRASGQTGPNTQQINFVSDDTWAETAINWNNKPATGASLGTAPGPVTLQWVEKDVTSQVTTEKSGDGKISFTVNMQDLDGSQSFYTRESTAGNRPELVVITSATPITTTFNPIADAYVDEANPTVNFGTVNRLLDKFSTPASTALLRFSLSGWTGPVASAKLRLKSSYTDGSSTQEAKFVSNDTWTETGVIWNNRPATGATLASLPSVVNGTWIEFDVTGQVSTEKSGDGLFSVAITSSAGTALQKYYSREATNPADAPQLVISNTPGSPSLRMKATPSGYRF